MFLCVCYLEEADEVAENQFVDVGQTQDHVHSCLWVVVMVNALVVELMRDQRLLQLPVPELQQRRWGPTQRQHDMTLISVCVGLLYVVGFHKNSHLVKTFTQKCWC